MQARSWVLAHPIPVEMARRSRVLPDFGVSRVVAFEVIMEHKSGVVVEDLVVYSIQITPCLRAAKRHSTLAV